MYCILEEPANCDAQAIGYGITTGDGTACIRGLSVNRADVEELVRVLNEYKLSPIHLHDYIDDWLAQ